MLLDAGIQTCCAPSLLDAIHRSRFRSGLAGSAAAGDQACQRCRDPEVNDPTRRPPGGLARAPGAALRRKLGKTVGCTACEQAGAANAQRSCGTVTPARQLGGTAQTIVGQCRTLRTGLRPWTRRAARMRLQRLCNTCRPSSQSLLSEQEGSGFFEATRTREL